MCKVDRMIMLALKNVDLEKNKQNVVAIIERGGSVLSIGHNDMRKTNPVYYNGSYQKGIHAEYDAINRCDSDIEGSTIYVFYVRRKGGLGNSRPCEDCMNLIKERGVSRMVYIMDDEIVKEGV